ncbi:BA14K family protein [Sinorhizobium sp. BG8]|uniref:BA14K family protein n=1 Tax=Sinorhizobium sp. BG8 TaxID=2613773 RepID=UPI00193E2E16|nr:BA14K family protein [Sinorhizobium sp. BG8]QRM53743.1 BA14K family protein [Sinorhizobium sp. BG8]
MIQIVKRCAAAVLSAAVFATTFVPVQATAMPRTDMTVSSDIETVQYRHHHRPRPGYYNGHQGYRYHRDGYRRYSDGYWYPLAAFGAGAIIGGAIASQPRYVEEGGVNPRHYEWCAARYRSYRAYDNTFNPGGYGGRRQCLSPYY